MNKLPKFEVEIEKYFCSKHLNVKNVKNVRAHFFCTDNWHYTTDYSSSGSSAVFGAYLLAISHRPYLDLLGLALSLLHGHNLCLVLENKTNKNENCKNYVAKKKLQG